MRLPKLATPPNGDSRGGRAIGKPCSYCGNEMTGYGYRHATSDHILPRWRFAKWADDERARYGAFNRAMVCFGCNASKKNYTLVEWHARLVAGKDPRAETVGSFIASMASLAPTEIISRLIGRALKEPD